jgi:hypothetical protein
MDAREEADAAARRSKRAMTAATVLERSGREARQLEGSPAAWTRTRGELMDTGR